MLNNMNEYYWDNYTLSVSDNTVYYIELI